MTYYTVFVIDLASRRVHVLGSTPHPTELFMGQMVRLVTAADDGVLVGHRALICDRYRKWSRAVRQQLGEAGIRVILTPERAPNANVDAERFVRSIKEECLDRMIPVGERHFRRAVAAEWTGYRAVPRFEGTAAREPRVLTPLGLPPRQLATRG